MTLKELQEKSRKEFEKKFFNKEPYLFMGDEMLDFLSSSQEQAYKVALEMMREWAEKREISGDNKNKIRAYSKALSDLEAFLQEKLTKEK